MTAQVDPVDPVDPAPPSGPEPRDVEATTGELPYALRYC